MSLSVTSVTRAVAGDSDPETKGGVGLFYPMLFGALPLSNIRNDPKSQRLSLNLI